jgi:hypothetical protein
MPFPNSFSHMAAGAGLSSRNHNSVQGIVRIGAVGVRTLVGDPAEIGDLPP